MFYVALKEEEKIQQGKGKREIERILAEVEMAALNLRRRKEALVKETRRKEVLKGTEGTARHRTDRGCTCTNPGTRDPDTDTDKDNEVSFLTTVG